MLQERTAEESRQEHARRKEEVLHLLEKTIGYYEQNGQEEDVEAFRKLKEDLNNGEFSIVVVGEFSAGKSTLLNALMRQRILPSYSNETTATVNFLRHKEKAQNGEAGIVYYNDGSRTEIKELSVEEIGKYATTKGDTSGVSHIDLYLDSDFLKDGVKLVDSPGLNGIADGHREITEAQIKQSHASIFLFNSDHPGSKTDFEFLHNLQKHVKTIIFVLNKIDDIKKDEGETVESVIDSLKASYRKQFPEETQIPEIWPVAAYPALVARNREPMEYHDRSDWTAEEKSRLEKNSRLAEFEDRLFRFLTCGEKAQQELLAPVQRVKSVTMQQRKSALEEIDFLKSTVDTLDIENQIAAVQSSMEDMEKESADDRVETSKMINDVVRNIQEELKANLADLSKRKLREIDEYEDVEELLECLENFESKYVQRAQSIAYDAEESLRNEIMNVVRIHHDRYSGQLENDIPTEGFPIPLAVRNHLDTEIKLFDAGLEKMDEKVRAKEEEIRALEQAMNSAEENYVEDRANERKRKRLESEIQALNEKMDMLRLQELPPVRHYTDQVHEVVNRKGFLGSIAQFFVGGKERVKNVQCQDSSEHDEAEERRNRQIGEFQDAAKAAEREKQLIADADVEYSERKWEQASNELYASREEMKQMLDANTEEIKKNYKRNVRKLKNRLTDFCDTISDEIARLAKFGLDKSKNSYTELVLNAVEADTRKSLEAHKKRIELLQEQMKASTDDKNKKIADLEEQIHRMDEILEEAVEVQANLESQEIDRIAQSTL